MTRHYHSGKAGGAWFTNPGQTSVGGATPHSFSSLIIT